MSLISKIKALFKKDLAAIVAPLEKIHAKLDAYILESAKAVEANAKKIEELLEKNNEHTSNQNTATTVQTNLKALLGK